MERVVVIDGECVLCSRMGRLLHKVDRKGSLRVLTSASSQGSLLLSAHGLNGGASVVYVENGRTYMASEAVIRLFSSFKGPWTLFSMLLLIPASWRDGIYFWVARNRYLWFGRNPGCEINTGLGITPDQDDRSKK